MLWGPERLKSVQPVRPVAPIGQTGLTQADKKKFWFSDLSRDFELMAVINLITED